MTSASRIVYIDVIRILACICIFTIHFNASICGFDRYGFFAFSHEIVPNYYFDIYLGSLGVGLFFIVSGAALQLKPLTKLDSGEIVQFYKKRALSIYPAFWIAFFVATLFCFYYYKGMTDADVSELVASLLGLDGYLYTMVGWGGGFYQVGEWFIGCIILIYLIYPLLSISFTKQPLITTIVISSLFLFVKYYTDLSPYFLTYWLPYVLAGMILTRYFRQVRIAVHLVIIYLVILGSCLAHAYSFMEIYTIFVCIAIYLILQLLVSLLELKTSMFSEARVSMITKISLLTYPIFLVHHKVISIIVNEYYLEGLYFPYRYSVVLYLICFTVTVILSYFLLKYSRTFTDFLVRTFNMRK